MTTIKARFIDVGDLTTLRLTCGKCKAVSVVDVATWAPQGTAGQVFCLHCGMADWGKAGVAVVKMAYALRSVQASAPPATVTAQFEIVDEQPPAAAPGAADQPGAL